MGKCSEVSGKCCTLSLLQVWSCITSLRITRRLVKNAKSRVFLLYTIELESLGVGLKDIRISIFPQEHKVVLMPNWGPTITTKTPYFVLCVYLNGGILQEDISHGTVF